MPDLGPSGIFEFNIPDGNYTNEQLLTTITTLWNVKQTVINTRELRYVFNAFSNTFLFYKLQYDLFQFDLANLNLADNIGLFKGTTLADQSQAIYDKWLVYLKFTGKTDAELNGIEYTKISNFIESVLPMNTGNTVDVIHLEIEDLNQMDELQEKNQLGKIFAVVHNNRAQKPATICGGTSHFNPPLKKLNRFKLKFKQNNQTLVDFKNNNVTLVFKINTLDTDNIKVSHICKPKLY